MTSGLTTLRRPRTSSPATAPKGLVPPATLQAPPVRTFTPCLVHQWPRLAGGGIELSSVPAFDWALLESGESIKG